MPPGTKAQPAENRWVYQDGPDFALLFEFGKSSPENPRYAPQNRAGTLAEVVAHVQGRVVGTFLEREETLHRNSFLGRAVVMSYEQAGGKRVYNARLFVGEARLIQVVAVTSEAQRHDPRIDRFFDSLRLP